MSSELKPKVIEGVAPVTLAECVYYGDGTTSTVKELLDNITNSGGSSGGSTTVNISGNCSVEAGNVFFENTAEITALSVPVLTMSLVTRWPKIALIPFISGKIMTLKVQI